MLVEAIQESLVGAERLPQTGDASSQRIRAAIRFRTRRAVFSPAAPIVEMRYGDQDLHVATRGCRCLFSSKPESHLRRWFKQEDNSYWATTVARAFSRIWS